MKVENASAIRFEAVHRLGKHNPNRRSPRPVIVRLSYISDRDRIWSSRQNLKGTPYIIEEDLPESYQKARRNLMPVMKAARLDGKKCMFVADKIRVDGNLYGVNDLTRLPESLSPQSGCIRETADAIAFFGQHTPFSNFFRSNIAIEGHTYNCTEQYIQKSKAEIMGCEEVAAQVLKQADPAKQKQMCKNLKGDIRKWKSQARDVAYKVAKSKFQQDPELLQYLKSTDKKTLAEASRDTEWGTGIPLQDKFAVNVAAYGRRART